nr:[FeFe] hydrogenase H-cluster radical SAM maturase HydE [Iocasia fonsfrigidae]
MLEIKSIINKAVQENELSKNEIVKLLQIEEEEILEYLYQQADKVRKKYHGDDVHLRGIIEFSSYCKRDCYYCGLRKGNNVLKRYQLKTEDIITQALEGVKLGYKTIVLQSGEDDYDAEKIAYIVKEIKAKADTAITLCVGERSFDDYRLWKEAGADRYLLKHETADKDLYQRLHPGMKYEDRIERLIFLKELGFQTGSGNIIGLPGQSQESLAEDILLFKELKMDMIGIGPFIPHQETPLKDENKGTVEMTLKVLAITRLLLPLSHLPATTALGSIDNYGRQKALQAGANVVMPNITASKYRSRYEIYPAKICIEEKAADCRQCIGGIINSLGRIVAIDRGDSLYI